jgi:diguanylate cyclase (GGDEF)-like protein
MAVYVYGSKSESRLSMTTSLRKAILTGALITAGSVLASFLPTWIWLQIDPVVDHSSVYISCIGLPMIIAPTCSFFVLRAQMRAERLALANHRLANSDELTGLPNRRAFFTAAEQLQGRAALGEGILACGIADIDNFKRVNDEHGHAAGDNILKSVGGAMRAMEPEGGVMARLGGEEFAAAGLFATEADARHYFQDLVRALGGEGCVHGGHRLRVTISLGYCLAREGDTVSALLSRADQALYRAKAAGKNRAVGDAPAPGRVSVPA